MMTDTNNVSGAVICIGDELLFGQIQNTNDNTIAGALCGIGISVHEIITIGDSENALTEVLDRLMEEMDVIVITGGLGPTSDDHTKQVLNQYTHGRFVFHDDIYSHIQELFRHKAIAQLESNRLQAELPDTCVPLHNKWGTAPGMWFDWNEKIIIALPGVPAEMTQIMEDEVMPSLQSRFNLSPIVHKYILTAGEGESKIAERLKNVEERLPPSIQMAYIPKENRVDIRLSSVGPSNLSELETWQKQIAALLPDITYSLEEGKNLVTAIGDILKHRKEFIATAESCTGGNIAASITENPNCSAYFNGSVVTYSNEIKERVLAVNHKTLRERGAVSEQTVREMVTNVCDLLQADAGIAVSGIAGPSGGSKEKPVGTVWVAVGYKGRVFTRLFQLKGDRGRIIEWTTWLSLNMMYQTLRDQF